MWKGHLGQSIINSHFKLLSCCLYMWITDSLNSKKDWLMFKYKINISLGYKEKATRKYKDVTKSTVLEIPRSGSSQKPLGVFLFLQCWESSSKCGIWNHGIVGLCENICWSLSDITSFINLCLTLLLDMISRENCIRDLSKGMLPLF